MNWLIELHTRISPYIKSSSDLVEFLFCLNTYDVYIPEVDKSNLPLTSIISHIAAGHTKFNLAQVTSTLNDTPIYQLQTDYANIPLLRIVRDLNDSIRIKNTMEEYAIWFNANVHLPNEDKATLIDLEILIILRARHVRLNRVSFKSARCTFYSCDLDVTIRGVDYAYLLAFLSLPCFEEGYRHV